MRRLLIACVIALAVAPAAAEVKVNGQSVTLKPGERPAVSSPTVKLIGPTARNARRDRSDQLRGAGANQNTTINNIIVIQPTVVAPGLGSELTPTVAPARPVKRDPRTREGCRQVMGQIMVGCEEPAATGWKARANRARNQ